MSWKTLFISRGWFRLWLVAFIVWEVFWVWHIWIKQVFRTNQVVDLPPGFVEVEVNMFPAFAFVSIFPLFFYLAVFLVVRVVRWVLQGFTETKKLD